MAGCAGLSLNGSIGTVPILNHQQDALSGTVKTGKLSLPTIMRVDYEYISIKEV